MGLWIGSYEYELYHTILVGGLEHFFPYLGNNNPNWLSYFSEGLKPPTRIIHSGKIWKIRFQWTLLCIGKKIGAHARWRLRMVHDGWLRDQRTWSLAIDREPSRGTVERQCIRRMHCRSPGNGFPQVQAGATYWRISNPLVPCRVCKEARQEEMSTVEPNRVCWLGVSQPPFSFIFGEAPCTSHSLDLSIHLTYPTAKSVSSEVSGRHSFQIHG